MNTGEIYFTYENKIAAKTALLIDTWPLIRNRSDFKPVCIT